MASSFAGGIDQRGGNRFTWRLAAPQHELENGIETLAFLKRRFADRLGMLEAHCLALTDQRRMAKDDQARTRPEFEMAEP